MRARPVGESQDEPAHIGRVLDGGRDEGLGQHDPESFRSTAEDTDVPQSRIRELGAEPLAQQSLERCIISRAGYLDPERSGRAIASVKLRLLERLAVGKRARYLVELTALSERVRGARQAAVGDPCAIDRTDHVGERRERREDGENERHAQGIE